MSLPFRRRVELVRVRSIEGVSTKASAVIREQEPSMPMPMWVGQVNKRVFNKMELKKGVRPVLVHVGRSSGTTYRTPLDAHKIDGGYIFILMYGSASDWVQNILAGGAATLHVDGEEIALRNPRVITKVTAWQQLRDTTKPPPEFLNVTEYLQMDLAG